MARGASATVPAQQPTGSLDRQATLGLVALLLAAAAVLAVVWLAFVQFARETAVYDVELNGQVQGLSRGGAVYMNGVRTGEVLAVGLDPRDPSKVVARIRMSADTPVRQDTIASLEWLGVSGSRYIQLSGGTLARPMLKRARGGDRVPVIHSAAAPFDRNNPDGKSAAVQALEALNTVNQRLSDENLAAIGEALDGARTSAAAMRGQAQQLAGVNALLDKGAEAANAVAKSAEAANAKVNGEWRDQVVQLGERGAQTQASIRNARTQMAQAGAGAEAKAQTLAPLTTAAARAQALAERAGAVVERLDSGGPVVGSPAGKTLKVER